MADWTPYYSTGTASISNGSTTVTGQSSSWSTAGLRAGDLFGAAGIWVPIASINSNTSITLARSWPGSSRTTDYYDIQRVSDADRLIAAHADLMASLTPNLTALGGLTLAANKMFYATGVSALALTDLSSAGRSLIGASDAAAMRTVLALGSAAVRTSPGTTTDNSVVRFDGTGGNFQTSGVSIADNNNVWGISNLDLTGSINLGGDDVSNARTFTLNTAAGYTRDCRWTTAGSPRWIARVSSSAESGGNAGSDFALNAYADNGSFLSSPLSITRATGVTTMPGVYATTTADASNVNVSSGGTMRRSTSSMRYKRDVEPADLDLSRAIVYGSQPIWYRSKCESDPADYSYWGLSAEQVAAIDPRMVAWAHPFVEEVEEVEEQVAVTRKRRRRETHVDIEDGHAVLRTIDVVVEEPVYDHFPLFDERGEPVIGEDGKQMLHRVEQMKTVKTRLRRQVPDTSQPMRPESVAYDRYVPHLINVIGALTARIGLLEEQIDVLKSTS